MKKYYYDCIEHGAPEKVCDLEELQHSACECDLHYYDGGWSAEIFAKDYYDNHDGWEDDWPITFRTWDEEGVWLGDYMVELDYDPTFNATEVTE